MDCEKMMGKRARAFCAAVLFFAAMAIGFSACGNGEELEGSTVPKGSQQAQTQQTVNPLTGLSGFREAAVGRAPSGGDDQQCARSPPAVGAVCAGYCVGGPGGGRHH